MIKMLKKKVAEKIPAEINKEDITIPPKDMGDYALPCYVLAKELKKDPKEIAKELAEKIETEENISKAKDEGGYLNIFLNKEFLTKSVLKQVKKSGRDYGSLKLGEGKKALVEHTSVNPNASPHLGRARNSFIGDSVQRLMRFQGYKTEVHYYVNDVGKQIAMLAYACKTREVYDFSELLDIYVQVNEELKENPEKEKEIFSLLNRLENGDKEIKDLFKKVVDICLTGQKELFNELDIKFDYYDYESKYLWNNRTSEILEMLEKTGKVFVDEHGRKILDLSGYDLPMKNPVFVLTREDGTSLYGLRDISYTIDKIKRATENNVIILGEDHKLYLKQLAAALELLGFKAPDVIHYSFVLLKEGKMSTRKGNLVLLSEVMEKAKFKAAEEIKKRNPNMEENEVSELSKIIGYGAAKFTILKTSPEKNVTFDWEKALNFEGDSAPYIQYTYARIQSILNKYKANVSEKVDFSLYNEHEAQLAKKLSEFEEVLANEKPHLLANYLLELTQDFNNYYHNNPILNQETPLKKARLLLAESTGVVIKTGLELLGINAPERM